MVKLTKEEKQAKKEAKKLEKLKAAIEAQRKAKRDELQREIVAQAARKGELDKSWRDMMIKIKEPVFRQDIEVMWHVFERAYDKKNHLINYTRYLCNEADEQFQRAMASFSDITDALINKFLSDLEEMSKHNDKRTKALLESEENTTNKMQFDHNEAETHLQLLLFHAHTTFENIAWTKRGKNLVKEDEDRMKLSNERDLLRSMLENNYNDIWEKYKYILKSYVMNTAENQKQVRKLRRKENQMADIIASQGKKIANNGGLLKHLRSELAAYESGTKQAVFRERRNTHRDACNRLKKNMYTGLETDVEQLSTLVKCSDDAINWLNTAHVKCDKIMRLASLCRKFETRQEKITPYGSFIPHSAEEMKIAARRHQLDDPLLSDEILSSCGLTRLWQRVSHAELTKRALLREKKLLMDENATMERKLQDKRDHIFTPDTSKCLCNALNIDKRKISRPNAIEGSLEIRKFVPKNAK